jgi:hypothetical protein
VVYDEMVELGLFREGFEISKTYVYVRKSWLTSGKATKKLYSQIMEA